LAVNIAKQRRYLIQFEGRVSGITFTRNAHDSQTIGKLDNLNVFGSMYNKMFHQDNENRLMIFRNLI